MLWCAGRHDPRRAGGPGGPGCPGCPECPGCLAVESLALVTSGNMLWAMLWARHIETSHTNHIKLYVGYDKITGATQISVMYTLVQSDG